MTTLLPSLRVASSILLAAPVGCLACDSAESHDTTIASARQSVCAVQPLTPVSASASGSENSGLGPQYAIDGDFGTRWSSNFIDPSWLSIDLGVRRHIGGVVLHWEAAASADYDLQVADDAGGPWTTIYSDASGNGGTDDISGLSAEARYLRVYSRSRTTVWGNSLWEVEILGDSNPQCEDPGPGPECGNGVLESGEECDDGNSTSGDGCDALCLLEEAEPPSGGSCFKIWGERNDYWLVVNADAKVVAEPGAGEQNAEVFEFVSLGSEQWKIRSANGPYLAVENNELTASATVSSAEVFTRHDCGAANRYGFESSSGSAPHWKESVTGEPIRSGDGGNGGACNPGDGGAWEAFYLEETPCAATPNPTCGDGSVDAGEQCDDGNNTTGDGCDSSCQLETAVCGNGTVETGEACDDGNTANGDGCSDSCVIEATCSDGAQNQGETGVDCGGPCPACDPGDPDADAPSERFEYAPDTSIFPNPERGFYRYSSLTSGGSFDYVHNEGKRLVYTNVELQDYLGANHEQDLPGSLLSAVQAGFDAVRDARVKAVVRFRYDGGEGYPGGANDAPETWIMRHIEQLQPLLAANEDVLYLMQAGFIGAWGEWHTSNNFVDGTGDAAARARIIDALLAALPVTRRTAVRYPAYKRMFYGTGPTIAADILNDADIARVGHLNDCFVSGPGDVGTYQYEPQDILQDYLEQDTVFVPNGGESCAVHERNACSTALDELARFHFSYLNDDYHPDVLQRWSDEGCRPEIERRLGYRLALQASELPAAVRPGGSFTLSIELQNEGFAAPTNPRPVFVVFEQGAQRSLVQLTEDPRLWTPGSVTLSARIRVPSDAPLGSYRVALWLPDLAEGLRSLSDYSIRLAAQGVWDAPTGDNTLGTLEVDPAAPGGAVTNAGSWSLLPLP